MPDFSEQILNAICEMRDLIRLMAEPQIAARDQKLRDELIRIVGTSAPKAKSIFLMDGNLKQSEICKKTGIHKGYLSTLVKVLNKKGLLAGEAIKPKLAIPIPPNFFEKGASK